MKGDDAKGRKGDDAKKKKKETTQKKTEKETMCLGCAPFCASLGSWTT